MTPKEIATRFYYGIRMPPMGYNHSLRQIHDEPLQWLVILAMRPHIQGLWATRLGCAHRDKHTLAMIVILISGTCFNPSACSSCHGR